MLLKGQSVLVTGAARGAGAGIAWGAAEEGAHVTAVDREPEGLKALEERACAAGLELQTVVGDVATADDNTRAVHCAERAFGPLNAFVANAAIIRFADTLATSDDDWEAIHAVNLRGVHLGIKAAIPSLRRACGGSIILIASVLGMVGDPLLPAYGAMKGGLRAMCRSIAVAHAAENIRCNTICPGDIDTPMMQEQLKRETDPVAARAQMLSHYPMKRFASPRDVANAVIFLASERASYITGTDMVVDGGFLAKCY